MLAYLLRRILIFIPTLVIISLLAFVISINSPADPVEMMARSASAEGNSTESSATESIKNEIRARLGLNLPVFYFSIATAADPDSLHKIASQNQRKAAQKLVRQFGNWEEIQSYLVSVNLALSSLKTLDTVKESELWQAKKDELIFNTLSLQELYDEVVIQNKLSEIVDAGEFLKLDPLQFPTLFALPMHFEKVQLHAQTWKNYLPVLRWNGLDNQYHIWLFGNLGTTEKGNRKGFIRGDFGYSYADNQPISKKIGGKFLYSFLLVLISILIAYLISIPLGVYAAYKNNSPFDNISSILTFMLYSLPGFFVGTWLLYYFANPDHFYWFPTGGVKDPGVFDPEWSWMQKLAHQSPYFVLPILTYTYSSFAFISRIMKVSVLEVLGMDYIKTARAKGLTEYQVITRHALKNSLLPIVTLFADIFPAALGGSVILETIFSIPGMGFEIYNAVVATDIPMIVAVFTLTGVLTVIGYLFSDFLYAIVDPRIRYNG